MMGIIGMCFSSFSNTSHSEPNIATVFWRRSRRKVIAEQRTASSRFFLAPSDLDYIASRRKVTKLALCYICSPEHPSLRSRGRSMLSTGRNSSRDYTGDASPSRYSISALIRAKTFSVALLSYIIWSACLYGHSRIVFLISLQCRSTLLILHCLSEF